MQRRKKKDGMELGVFHAHVQTHTQYLKKATVVIGTIKSTERGKKKKKNVIHDNNITRILSSSLNARVNAATLHFCSFYLLTHDSKTKFRYFSEHIYTDTYTHTHTPTAIIAVKKKRRKKREKIKKRKKR